MIRLRCLAGVLIALVAWSTPLFALNPTLLSTQTDRLWRLAASEQAMLRQSGHLLNDPSLADYLNATTERLWEQVESDLNCPTVEIIMDTGMDAYTYPNGYIVLTTGLINEIENEDQLAMILAHEMVHYARQHTVALYDHLQRQQRGDSVARDADAHHLFTPGAAVARIDVAERQADREGLTILRRAGYCQAEVLVLMSNLAARISDAGADRALESMLARRTAVETLIAQDSMRSSCVAASDADRSFFLQFIAPSLIANAQAALRHGDWRLADRSVSRFMALNPEDARAYYLRGELTRRQNDEEGSRRCIGFFETALEMDPGQPLAHRALGEVHFKAGRYQLAKPHFEAFLSLAPQDEACAFIKGYLLQCQK